MSSLSVDTSVRESDALRPRHRGGWLGSFISWFALLLAVAVALVMVVVPLIAGATPYTVLTGSMRPGMPPGSLAVVRPVDVNTLGVGDVVTYQVRSGDPEVITHRIVAQSIDSHGERTFITRGDANGADDADPVVPGQIHGKLWYSVPVLGYVNSLLDHGQRSLLIVIVSAALFGYAAYMFVSAGLDSVRRRRARS